MKGIDVSTIQGAINWRKVKADSVEFAIIKATQGRGEGVSTKNLRLFTDSRFDQNIVAAHNAGIRSGDVLLKVAGKRVHTLDDYMEVLATLSFGEQIQVRFISKETGKKQTVTVDLDAVAGNRKR